MELGSLDFVGLAALVTSLIMLVKLLTKDKLDNKKQKTDMASQLGVLAEQATMKNIELYKRVVKLETNMLDTQADIRSLIRLQDDWCDGINLLLAQIKERGEEPIWEPDLTRLQKLKDKLGDK